MFKHVPQLIFSPIPPLLVGILSCVPTSYNIVLYPTPATVLLVRYVPCTVVPGKKVIVKSVGRDKSACYPPFNCPNCRLASRCSACQVALREKLIHDIWNEGNGP